MKKEYQCRKCNTKFHRGLSNKFVKTILPLCPTCGASDVKAIITIEKKKKK